MKNFDKIARKLEKKVREKLKDAPGCHRWDHTERVLHNAKLIAKNESNCEPCVIECAALLHDIARPEEMKSKGKICHAEKGAELAKKILKKCGIKDKKFIKAVHGCVLRHRFRKGENPETIEEKIIYDADKLDSTGAIGIGRAFHFAGRFNARVHNKEKEALKSKAYSTEDTAYREYLVKQRKIVDKMQTESGKKMAVERTEFMKKFFERLNREAYGK